MTISTYTSPSFKHAGAVKTSPLRLDRNENPCGPSPLAIKAARHALLSCHRYPDAYGSALKLHLATHLGISANAITLGNGSEALLELLGKSYLSPQNSAILTNYSFIRLKKIIQPSGTTVKIVTNTPQYTTAIQILEAVEVNTKLLFIVNPNNPTGTYINSLELNYLLEQLPAHTLVVMDEAYAEYVEATDYPNTLKLLATYPNLVISRTFSKFYGLAGLRVGYLISHPDIAKQLHSLRLPFSVNAIALAATQAALQDPAHMALVRTTNQHGKQQLIHGLKKLALTALPSQTNFICVNLERDSLDVYTKLISENIYVKPLHDHGLANYLRISIGLENENQRLLEALYKMLALGN